MTEKHCESLVVVSDSDEAQAVVEKRPKTLSAAQAKREPKPRKVSKNWVGLGPIPGGPRYDHFSCAVCLRETPTSEIGGYFNHTPRCKACCEQAVARKNGTEKVYCQGRDGKPRPMDAAKARANKQRSAQKNYKKKRASLPPWMFS